MGVLLKPLRVKRDITAERRRESRKTGAANRENAERKWAARERGPVFPATQARGL
jgi:hypothetical protein